jgi:hypothetical protein
MELDYELDFGTYYKPSKHIININDILEIKQPRLNKNNKDFLILLELMKEYNENKMMVNSIAPYVGTNTTDIKQ